MATLRAWLAKFTKTTGEQVDEIVLGWGEWSNYHKDDWPEWDGWAATYPLSSIPEALLDQEFHDDGFGGNESPNLCGWSPSWVVFSVNYDGAESIVWVPRNPTAHEPARPGGG